MILGEPGSAGLLGRQALRRGSAGTIQDLSFAWYVSQLMTWASFPGGT